MENIKNEKKQAYDEWNEFRKDAEEYLRMHEVKLNIMIETLRYITVPNLEHYTEESTKEINSLGNMLVKLKDQVQEAKENQKENSKLYCLKDLYGKVEMTTKKDFTPDEVMKKQKELLQQVKPLINDALFPLMYVLAESKLGELAFWQQERIGSSCSKLEHLYSLITVFTKENTK